MHSQMHTRMLKPFASIAVGSVLSVQGVALGMENVTNANENASLVEAKFLITISEPGSYRLTDNLVVTDANTTAIEINADDVTIDMNGFSIHGPGACAPPPVSCIPTGTGNGIHAINRNN